MELHFRMNVSKYGRKFKIEGGKRNCTDGSARWHEPGISQKITANCKNGSYFQLKHSPCAAQHIHTQFTLYSSYIQHGMEYNNHCDSHFYRFLSIIPDYMEHDFYVALFHFYNILPFGLDWFGCSLFWQKYKCMNCIFLLLYCDFSFQLDPIFSIKFNRFIFRTIIQILTK